MENAWSYKGVKMELNKFYNMDCREGMKQIPDGSVDLTVTSPLVGLFH